MFLTVLNWLRGLSIVGKGILGVSTIGVMTAVASTPPPESAPTSTTPSVTAVSQPVSTSKEIKEDKAIPFSKITEETSALVSGTQQIKTTGVEGVMTRTFKVTYIDDTETKRELVKEEVTLAPIDEITLLGTYVAPVSQPRSNCDSNYSGGCVPVVSYDLDCGDIGFSVQVVGVDKHRFDGDRDGWGCEAY